MKNFHIGGVPEHFNLPWYLTLKNKEYHEVGINLRWKDYFGGTGEMSEALREKEIDMAVILTEGIVKEIIEGNGCKIVQTFVESPLIWGIHVAKNSSFYKVTDLKGTKAAISRYGSGSHLMAYVNAKRQGWNPKTDLEFEVVMDLEGALEALPLGRGDYFMWEKFTTKPYVDDGPFRLIGECPTPWPCFVIAVRDDILEDHESEIRSILDIINKTTYKFKEIPDIDILISKRYEQHIDDVQEWLALTRWSQENLSYQQVDLVQETLLELGLVKTKLPSEKILYFF